MTAMGAAKTGGDEDSCNDGGRMYRTKVVRHAKVGRTNYDTDHTVPADDCFASHHTVRW